jgi:DNA-binding transcriptional LysR family regulator
MERDPMDRLDAMSTFLAVVEAGSLSAAARQLKMPLTTIRRKISELEPYLRTKLFNRSSRQLVLTDAGSSYLAACKRILTDVTEAERTASGEYTAPTGELSMTTPWVLAYHPDPDRRGFPQGLSGNAARRKI